MTRQGHTGTKDPWFSGSAYGEYGLIRLPVAPECNIQCRYCIRGHDCVNEAPPGLRSHILDPDRAEKLVRRAVRGDQCIGTVRIDGPGEPLANPATFQTLARIHQEFPDLSLAVSTNGLLLSERLVDLLDAGVSTITVTVNAVDPETTAQLYDWIVYRGRKHEGKEAAALLLCNQWKGVQSAVETGFLVGMNYVLVPGINCREAPDAARIAASMGVDYMNVLPVVPQADLAGIESPSVRDLDRIRDRCSKHLPQTVQPRGGQREYLATAGRKRNVGSGMATERRGTA